MIVIGTDFSRPGTTRPDGQPVFPGPDADAEPDKLLRNRRQAVALLISDVSDPRDGHGGIRIGRDGREGDGLIGAGVHIRFHSFQPPLLWPEKHDPLRRFLHRTAHPFQDP